MEVERAEQETRRIESLWDQLQAALAEEGLDGEDGAGDDVTADAGAASATDRLAFITRPDGVVITMTLERDDADTGTLTVIHPGTPAQQTLARLPHADAVRCFESALEEARGEGWSVACDRPPGYDVREKRLNPYMVVEAVRALELGPALFLAWSAPQARVTLFEHSDRTSFATVGRTRCGPRHVLQIGIQSGSTIIFPTPSYFEGAADAKRERRAEEEAAARTGFQPFYSGPPRRG